MVVPVKCDVEPMKTGEQLDGTVSIDPTSQQQIFRYCFSTMVIIGNKYWILHKYFSKQQGSLWS